jgi:hypothetical protein
MKVQEVLRCIKSLPLTRTVGTIENYYVFYFYNYKHKEVGYKQGKWRVERLYRKA